MAVGIVVVATLAENPSRAGEGFSKCEEVGCDVGLIFREVFFGDGKLVPGISRRRRVRSCRSRFREGFEAGRAIPDDGGSVGSRYLSSGRC